MTDDQEPDGTPNPDHEHWAGDTAPWNLGDQPNGNPDPGTGHIHTPDHGLDWDSVEVDPTAPKAEWVEIDGDEELLDPVEAEYDDEGELITPEGEALPELVEPIDEGVETDTDQLVEYGEGTKEFLEQAAKAEQDEEAVLTELAKEDKS
jgi:hypothetical protein